MSLAGSLYQAIQGESWDDLRFPASGINPPGAIADPDVDTVTYPGTLLFSGSATELIAGVAQMPHAWVAGSGLRPHIHYSKTTSAAGGIVWEFCYAIAGVGETFGAFSDWEAGDDVVPHSDTANKHAIARFGEMDMAGKKPSVMIAWQLRRKHDAAGDTYGADARLWEVDFHYLVFGLGTDTEIPV